MPQPHWTDTVISQATADIERAKNAMRGVLFRPILRQPPIRKQIMEAIAAGAGGQAQPLPHDPRERLFSMLYDKYGEQAKNVASYLGIAEEE